jgi:hypothetical protein
MSEQNFTPSVTQWLNTYRQFVGSELPLCDNVGGRSLGPASGTLGDCFPFLRPGAYHGIFAGLSISGLTEADANGLQLVRYVSSVGFHNVEDGPFSGNGWQGMSSDDWITFDPTVYTSCNYWRPEHEVDLLFATKTGKYINTEDFVSYFSIQLSRLYRQHVWISADGVVITAVTFTAVQEHQAPFLRPFLVDEINTDLDPYCFFNSVPKLNLFGGLVILTAGAGTQITVNDEKEDGKTVVTLSKTLAAIADTTEYVRTISNTKPNTEGHFSLISSHDCYKFTPIYDAIDSETGITILEPGTIAVQNHCTTCCPCEDYVEQYELLRELFTEQEQYINTYNTIYDTAKKVRDELEEHILEASQLVQVRYRSDEPETTMVTHGEIVEFHTRYVFSLVYANISSVQKRYGKITITVHCELSTADIQYARLLDVPEKSGLEIEQYGGDIIELSEMTLGSHTVKDIRLYVTLLGEAASLGKVTLTLDREILEEPEPEPEPEEPAEENNGDI